MYLKPTPLQEEAFGTPAWATIVFPYPMIVLIAGVLLGIPNLSRAQETPSTTVETGPVSSAPSDEEILKRLTELPTDYLQNLLSVYLRLGNDSMSKALTGELNSRGSTVKSTESIQNEAMGIDNSPPSPYEALENEIDVLMNQKRYAEVIAKMEKLRAGQFSGKVFPFEIELADAYGTIGDFEKARTLYSDVLNRPSSTVKQKALAQAGIVEIEKLVAVKAAYDMIKQRKPEAALEMAEALKKKFPQDVEIQLLYAQALVPNFRYAEALPLLESIKAKYYVGKVYPAQDALSESLVAMGEFEEARAAYEILLTDKTLLPHERMEAVVAAREANHMRVASVQADAEFIKEAEGRGRFFRMRADAPVAPRLHAGVDAWYYDVSLSNDRSLKQPSGDFTGATAFVRHYLDDQFTYREARAGGGSHGDAILGFSIGKERAHEGAIGYDLSIDLNTPAIDSLQLIALNGVEDIVSADFVAPLPGKFQFLAGGFARQVQSDGADLGDGWGAFFEVGRVVWRNPTDTASLYVAYQSTYERFDAAQISEREAGQLGVAGDPADARSLAADLLEPLYSPNGLQANYDLRVNDRLSTYAGAGLNFDFSDEQWNYNFTSGLEYALTDSIDLVIEAGYYSDGTSASNNGAPVYLGNLGVRSYF